MRFLQVGQTAFEKAQNQYGEKHRNPVSGHSYGEIL